MPELVVGRTSSERQMTIYCLTGNCRDCHGFLYPLTFSDRRPCMHDPCHAPGGYGNPPDYTRAVRVALVLEM